METSKEIELDVDLRKKLQEILQDVQSKEINRMGRLFSTPSTNFFYDTGTGKVISLDDQAYYIMKRLYDGDTELKESNLLSNPCISKEGLKELLSVLQKEHLLEAIKPTYLYSPKHYEQFEELLDDGLEQLILELTGKCNLRCKYCIYNEGFSDYRTFNTEDMDEETAKKAIDYFFEHSRSNMAVTFYGGEPLMNFKLLKWSIEYSLEKNKALKKDLTFSLTTNMTLVTPEIAEFLASIPKLSIVCSIDGSEDIQNAYRVYPGGEGSYEQAFRGLRLLSKSFKKYDKSLGINVVFAPDYTFEKLNEIEAFFTELDFLPQNTNVEITYPSEGSVDSKASLEKIKDNPKYKSPMGDDLNPFWEWRRRQLLGNNLIREHSLVNSRLNQALIHINDRFIWETPVDKYPINGCCLPGERRLYVDTQGDFYPCERIGESPNIGNVNSGLDKERIKKYYIEDFVKGILPFCSNCWAIRLCNLCYMKRFVKSGFSPNAKECEGAKVMLEKYLSLYHEVMEECPEKLKDLEGIKTV